MKIAIVGPFPPPFGGISIHIKRMKKYLEDRDIECSVYNESIEKNSETNMNCIGPLGKFIFKIPFIKSDIIHFHLISKKIRMLMGVYSILRKKVVLTLHGESFQNQLNESGFLSGTILKWSMRNIDRIICVNEKIKELLLQLGVDKKNIAVIPAYINPVENESEKAKIPADVWSFIETANFLVAANGFIRLYDGKDLYGFDMLIELMKTVKDKGVKAHLLFALLGKEKHDSEESNYYSELKNRIAKYNLDDYICIYEVKNSELYPILKESKLFIRPTSTDGYGVSIAEAIYYNVPSIASDVCNRPEGTTLFESRNQKDLEEKVLNVINDYEHYKNDVKKANVRDYAEDVLNVYRGLL